MAVTASTSFTPHLPPIHQPDDDRITEIGRPAAGPSTAPPARAASPHAPAQGERGWRDRLREQCKDALNAGRGAVHDEGAWGDLQTRRNTFRYALRSEQIDRFVSGRPLDRNARRQARKTAHAAVGEAYPAEAGTPLGNMGKAYLRWKRHADALQYTETREGAMLRGGRQTGDNALIRTEGGDAYWLPGAMEGALREKLDRDCPRLSPAGPAARIQEGGISEVFVGVRLGPEGPDKPAAGTLVAIKRTGEAANSLLARARRGAKAPAALADASGRFPDKHAQRRHEALRKSISANEWEVWNKLPHSRSVIAREGRARLPGQTFLVSELAGRGDLGSLLDRLGSVQDQHQRAEMVRALAHKVLAAVRDLHAAGYFHRDLKPENLTLDNDGGLKLIDIGMCTNENKATMKVGGRETRVGTEGYRQPDTQGSDARTADLYATGAVLFAFAEAVAGRPSYPPLDFEGYYAESLRNDSGRTLEECARLLMAQNPAARPGLDEVARMPYFRDPPMPDSALLAHIEDAERQAQQAPAGEAARG